VALGWASAAGRSANDPTAFALGAGAVWTGTYYALSTEIMWPLNDATAHGLAFIDQFHLDFDDIFPGSIGKPLIESRLMKLFAASALPARLATGLPAFAHAFPVKADPTAGGTVTTAPAR
jgi:hypothetical protein